MKRSSGILMPISSLPSAYGIGTLGREAYAFADQLKKAGQDYWQILPLGPTGYGDSPYQSFSAFAGNPYFIDLDTLLQEGLVTEEEVRTPDFGQDDESRVDYQKLYENRFTLLKKAFERSNIASEDAFRKFCRENAFWLDDYCLFMAIKDEMGGRSWFEWPDEIRLRKAEAIADWESRTKEQADFYRFLQSDLCGCRFFGFLVASGAFPVRRRSQAGRCGGMPAGRFLRGRPAVGQSSV